MRVLKHSAGVFQSDTLCISYTVTDSKEPFPPLMFVSSGTHFLGSQFLNARQLRHFIHVAAPQMQLIFIYFCPLVAQPIDFKRRSCSRSPLVTEASSADHSLLRN